MAADINTKPRYEILDGLRGVAALMVVVFHIFEAHATSHLDQIVNHGYLAVDFFFLLSGYVIGYAYDDRWAKGMSMGTFFKRRLGRLQPMVIFGAIVGGALFYLQDYPVAPNIHDTPLWLTLVVMVIGMTLVPVPGGRLEIRGWGEMYPLNGPAWSLFYEYCANVLYALFVRRFSRFWLSVLVGVAAGALIHFAVTSPGGDIIGGWSLDPAQLRIGFTRLMYPFFAGLLLFRVTKPGRVGNAFLWCSLLVVAALAMPRVGGAEHLWANGLYDSITVIALFPLIVWMGASGSLKGKFARGVCKFLGDISYPIYITHYPLIYIYYGWVWSEQAPITRTWGWAVALFFGSIALAWLSFKLYDVPLRKWLTKVWK